jgi:SAM-dependent methyltransferase
MLPAERETNTNRSPSFYPSAIKQRKAERYMSESDSLAQHTSTGHRLSNADFIDAHYAVCRTMYETMIRAVGIQSGRQVLDAGCGSGSFLPLLAELVGPTGHINACDLAPENIARVQAIARRLDVPVTAEIGNVLSLPYADNSFDAVWNANVTQYLTAPELMQTIREFVRVVKPGGCVAIKESETTLIQFHPLDRFVNWRYLEQSTKLLQPGYLHAIGLPNRCKDAGLVVVTQATYLEEIRAPLDDHAHAFLSGTLQFFGQEAQKLPLSESDKVYWQRCLDPLAPDNPVNDPEFYFREGCTLVLGQKARAS